jgi:hypothetical protein
MRSFKALALCLLLSTELFASGIGQPPIKQPSVVTSMQVFSGVSLPSANFTSFAWPAANLAIFIPFPVQETSPVQRMIVNVGSAVAGNIDVGIYDESGNRKASSGSTPVGSANTAQSISVSVSLPPGRYYMAISLSSATTQIFAESTLLENTVIGVKELTSAFPLPSTAAFVDNNTRAYVPVISVSLET